MTRADVALEARAAAFHRGGKPPLRRYMVARRHDSRFPSTTGGGGGRGGGGGGGGGGGRRRRRGPPRRGGCPPAPPQGGGRSSSCDQQGLVGSRPCGSAAQDNATAHSSLGTPTPTGLPPAVPGPPDAALRAAGHVLGHRRRHGQGLAFWAITSAGPVIAVTSSATGGFTAGSGKGSAPGLAATAAGAAAAATASAAVAASGGRGRRFRPGGGDQELARRRHHLEQLLALLRADQREDHRAAPPVERDVALGHERQRHVGVAADGAHEQEHAPPFLVLVDEPDRRRVAALERVAPDEPEAVRGEVRPTDGIGGELLVERGHRPVPAGGELGRAAERVAPEQHLWPGPRGRGSRPAVRPPCRGRGPTGPTGRRASPPRRPSRRPRTGRAAGGAGPRPARGRARTSWHRPAGRYRSTVRAAPRIRPAGEGSR